VFRERTTVLSLDQCLCKYESTYDVQVDSWVLLEIDYSETGRKPSRVQGQVKSVSAPQSADQPFQVTVELQFAQPVKVVEDTAGGSSAVAPVQRLEQAKPANSPERQVEPVSPERTPATPAVSPQRTPAPATAEVHSPPRPAAGEGSVKTSASREPLENIRAQVMPLVDQAAREAVASEINRHLGVLKDWVSQEVEKVLQGGIGSRLDQFLRQAVEKRISENTQATVEAINEALVRKLVARLAESQELRASITGAAENLAARFRELSRAIAKKTEEDLAMRAIATRQTFEKSLVEMQRKLDEFKSTVETGVAESLNARVSALSQTIATKAEDDLTARAAAIRQAFERSAADVQRTLDEFKSTVETGAAENLNARFNALSQAIAKKAEEDLTARVAAIRQAFERSAAEAQRKLEEFKSTLETAVAENLNARLGALSQAIAKKAEEDLTARVATVRQAFEKSVAEAQRRFDEMRAAVETGLAGAQEAKREAVTQSLSLQEALEKFQQVGKAASEELERRHAANWDASLAALKKAADETSLEMASCFASEIEQQLTPHLQSAEEKTEKLAALLELAQGSVKVQEQQLADVSQAAMADLEKEISALFLRLSSNT
jgi:hypothetical protein